MADKIVVLRLGKIEQVGSPLDLYNRPDNRFVAGFIGSPQMNFVPVTIGPGGRVATSFGTSFALATESRLAEGEAYTLGVRPEHLTLEETPDALPLALTVTGVEQLGGHCLIYGLLPDGATRVTVHCEGQQATQIGDAVAAYAPAASCHLFDKSEQERVVR